MKLEINNIGKIRRALIDLRGLTVIVGDNNAGKSTIGKVLATVCYALQTLEDRLLQARKSYVFDEESLRYSYRFRMISNSEFRRCLENELSEEALESVMTKAWQDYDSIWNEPSNMISKLTESDIAIIKEASHIVFSRLKDCRNISDRQLSNSEVGKLFSKFFNRKVKSIGESEGSVILSTDSIRNSIVFEDNTACDFSSKNGLRGWFLGSPLLINNISRIGFRVRDPEVMHQPLLQRLNEFKEINSVSKAVVQEKLHPVASRIENILGGRLYYSEEDDELMISGEAYKNPLPVKSLSMGLKAFAVLFWMLEIEALQEGDILVLDEPENHLHPSWQIKYAEIVVLLQMCFGLKVLLTTHSPYFLEAIQLFAQKYGTDGMLDAYQPEFDDDGDSVTFLNKVTDNSVLFRKFTEPLRALDVLRAEMRSHKEAQ